VASTVFGVTGCSGTATNLSASLPDVQALEVDPKESYAELIEDSDLVVVGTITQVTAELHGSETPDAANAPELVLDTIRVEFTISPHDGAEDVAFAEAVTVRSDVTQNVLAEINAARLPSETMLFALTGPLDEWGYVCTSGDRALCGLAEREGQWWSPLAPEAAPLAKDPVQPREGVVALEQDHGSDQP
jgi:hypothetical protein